MFDDYKYAAQMRAEEAAEEEFGPEVDYFDLPEEVRSRLYAQGLQDHAEAMIEAADARRKAEREN